jgi:hypothetical protein
MRHDPQPKKQSPWEPTRYQNLFRYVPSGTIFARLKISSKQVRKSLKTSNLELFEPAIEIDGGVVNCPLDDLGLAAQKCCAQLSGWPTR